MPAVVKINVVYESSNPAPIARARKHSQRHRHAVARCVATSDDEHAVSKLKHGPVKASVKEIRPDAIDSAFAVAPYTPTCA